MTTTKHVKSEITMAFDEREVPDWILINAINGMLRDVGVKATFQITPCNIDFKGKGGSRLHLVAGEGV